MQSVVIQAGENGSILAKGDHQRTCAAYKHFLDHVPVHFLTCRVNKLEDMQCSLLPSLIAAKYPNAEHTQAILTLPTRMVPVLFARAEMHLRVGLMAASPLQAVRVKPAIRTDHRTRDHAEHVTRHAFIAWLLWVGLPSVPVQKYTSEQPAMRVKSGAVKRS